VRERSVTLERWADLCRLLGEYDALEFAARRAMEYAESARTHMDAFPASPEREALTALAEYVLTRDR